ncbi:hypothetical protein [Streptomyces chilikensis]|uniref:Large membrane protein n=1 Tax=Streptomyces chilikensis TaxID=1194079 RepID=A0ABV3ERP4_9ACTN
MKDDAQPAGGPDDGTTTGADHHDGTAGRRDPAPGAGTEAGAEAGGAAGPGDGPAPEAVGEEPAPPGRRSSPPRGRLAVAAVTAAVLAAAGMGAYAASSTDGTAARTASASGPADPEPLVLDGHGGVPQGLTFRAAGPLPDAPDTAPVYRPEGEVPAGRVAALAGSLGLEGAPRADGTVWKAGEELAVDRKAPASWTLTRPHPEGGTPVDEARARAAAAPVLKAVGQEDARVDASGTLGAERTVNADPVIGGLPTHGWTTALRVGPDATVTSGAGQLADPVRGDSYPLVEAREALKDLDRLSSGVGRAPEPGCASAVPHAEGDGGRPSGAVPPADPCAPEPVKRRTATVEGATLGLAAFQVDGARALVPSWLFQVRLPNAVDVLTVAHPAVDPAHVVTPEESPAERPSPRPTGPDDGMGTDRARVTGYRAENGRLTVAFEAGVCSDFTVRAEERGDRVEVVVDERKWPDRVCIMIAKIHHRTVELDEPLGGRTVVDSAGKPVPEERGPRPSAR